MLPEHTYTANRHIVAMAMSKPRKPLQFNQSVDTNPSHAHPPSHTHLSSPSSAAPSSEEPIPDVPMRHKLLQTGLFSDCTLIACGQTFKLHKAVICMQSEFFLKALTSGMREGITSTIELPEETELDDIQRLVKFMYEEDYRDKSTETATSAIWFDYSNIGSTAHPPTVKYGLENLWLDIRMYSLGKRYMMPKLQDFALCSFRRGLWSGVMLPMQAIRDWGRDGRRVAFVNVPCSIVPHIIDLARRVHLEGEDLSPEHASEVSKFCTHLYPILCQYQSFMGALRKDLGMIAVDILKSATPERSERLYEACDGCQRAFGGNMRMELSTWCDSCMDFRDSTGMFLAALT